MTGVSAAESAVRRALKYTCVWADEEPLDQLGTLLHDDVTWLMSGSERTGRADVLTALQVPRDAGLVGPGSRTRHLLTTILVEVDGPTATSRSSWLLIRATDTGVDLLMAGDYLDTWRIDDAPLLVRREVVRL